VALATFLVAALASSTVSEFARQRAMEADRRRAEADLTAEMARLLLAQTGVEEALALIGQRLAVMFELPWAKLTLDEVSGGGAHQTTMAVAEGGRMVGTLVIPADLALSVEARLRDRVVPALATVLAVALERERMVAEAVQTEGLKRSEAIKTAILRAVSHDLRTPVMAIMAAGAAVRAPELTLAERAELGTLVIDQGDRLSRLIEDLLDLSKLEAQNGAPFLAECSVEELIDAALAAQPSDSPFEVQIDPDVTSVRADFAQVERALANLLDNARRFSAGEPVVIRARPIGSFMTIRVTDRGPGIAPADQERIFEPFYRGSGGAANTGHSGSGLGLAIAKGFVEANGGCIWAESTPGMTTNFVISLATIADRSS
jgi:two-component system, OmpR family, sensor histidine kinase KdpD